jgi:hypothetical protein
MKPVRLIKICLNEIYSKVRIGRNLSDAFPTLNDLKQGDALSPLFLNFVLEYAIWKVQEKEGGLELNETRWLLVYANDANIFGGNMNDKEKHRSSLRG